MVEASDELGAYNYISVELSDSVTRREAEQRLAAGEEGSCRLGGDRESQRPSAGGRQGLASRGTWRRLENWACEVAGVGISDQRAGWDGAASGDAGWRRGRGELGRGGA